MQRDRGERFYLREIVRRGEGLWKEKNGKGKAKAVQNAEKTPDKSGKDDSPPTAVYCRSSDHEKIGEPRSGSDAARFLGGRKVLQKSNTASAANSRIESISRRATVLFE